MEREKQKSKTEKRDGEEGSYEAGDFLKDHKNIGLIPPPPIESSVSLYKLKTLYF